MTTTGWAGEAPDAENPAAPTANFILGMRAGPEERADPLTRARLARDRPDADLGDPDARAANLLARGVTPGMFTDLALKLADTERELAAERDKLDAGRRRQERIARDHAAGKITAFDIARMHDFDEGDAHRAGQLERRAGRLRQQLAEASDLVAPAAQRDPDPLESAASRAHQAFVEATRAKLAGTPAPRAPRPFASGDGEAAEVPDCPHCRDLMRSAARPVTAAEAAEIHRQAAALQSGQTEGDWLPCRHCGQPLDRCACSLAVR